MKSVRRKLVIAGVLIAVFMLAQFGNVVEMEARASETECEASVAPNQPWYQDGSAEVTLLESCGTQDTLTLPLKHFPPGQEVNIDRSEYPLGLVVVPTIGYPETNPAILPVKMNSGSSIIFKDQDPPNGAVGVFTES
jgi:hypothetical protein